MTSAPGDLALDLNRVDQILDRTVALGYGWPGSVARRRWSPADPAPYSLVEECVLITGATSGIGRAAAARCPELGATVHVGHNTIRAAEALQLRRACPSAVRARAVRSRSGGRAPFR